MKYDMKAVAQVSVVMIAFGLAVFMMPPIASVPMA